VEPIYSIEGFFPELGWETSRPLGIVEGDARSEFVLKKLEWNFRGLFRREGITMALLPLINDEVVKAIHGELGETAAEASQLILLVNSQIPYESPDSRTVAGSLDDAKSGKPLNVNQQKALEIIRESGPISGKVLAKRLTLEESTVRKHIIPTLKERGVRNDGSGYYVAHM